MTACVVLGWYHGNASSRIQEHAGWHVLQQSTMVHQANFGLHE